MYSTAFSCQPRALPLPLSQEVSVPRLATGLVLTTTMCNSHELDVPLYTALDVVQAYRRHGTIPRRRHVARVAARHLQYAPRPLRPLANAHRPSGRRPKQELTVETRRQGRLLHRRRRQHLQRAGPRPRAPGRRRLHRRPQRAAHRGRRGADASPSAGGPRAGHRGRRRAPLRGFGEGGGAVRGRAGRA